jgi:hypothetical protein
MMNDLGDEYNVYNDGAINDDFDSYREGSISFC